MGIDMKSAVVACLGTLGIMAGCSAEWETVELPAGMPPEAAIAIDLWAPYDLYALKTEAEDVYGRPDTVGSESEGKHQVYFKGYDGDYGRLLIWSEDYPTEDSWEHGEWIELIPKSLALDQLLHRDLLQAVPFRRGEWKLAVRERGGRKSFMTVIIRDDQVERVTVW
jgi:hypothetical protein